MWHATTRFTTPPFLLCHLASEFLELSHNSAVCRDVYKHVARMVHTDKGPTTRSAYHCAMADIAMEAAQRASVMVASSSSSDRRAFPLVPALDLAQFSAMVEAHWLANIGHTPLVRSTTAPSTAGGLGDSCSYRATPPPCVTLSPSPDTGRPPWSPS